MISRPGEHESARMPLGTSQGSTYRTAEENQHESTTKMPSNAGDEDEPDDLSVPSSRVVQDAEVGQAQGDLESQDPNDIDWFPRIIELFRY